LYIVAENKSDSSHMRIMKRKESADSQKSDITNKESNNQDNVAEVKTKDMQKARSSSHEKLSRQGSASSTHSRDEKRTGRDRAPLRGGLKDLSESRKDKDDKHQKKNRSENSSDKPKISNQRFNEMKLTKGSKSSKVDEKDGNQKVQSKEKSSDKPSPWASVVSGEKESTPTFESTKSLREIQKEEQERENRQTTPNVNSTGEQVQQHYRHSPDENTFRSDVMEREKYQEGGRLQRPDERQGDYRGGKFAQRSDRPRRSDRPDRPERKPRYDERRPGDKNTDRRDYHHENRRGDDRRKEDGGYRRGDNRDGDNRNRRDIRDGGDNRDNRRDDRRGDYKKDGYNNKQRDDRKDYRNNEKSRRDGNRRERLPSKDYEKSSRDDVSFRKTDGKRDDKKSTTQEEFKKLENLTKLATNAVENQEKNTAGESKRHDRKDDNFRTERRTSNRDGRKHDAKDKRSRDDRKPDFAGRNEDRNEYNEWRSRKDKSADVTSQPTKKDSTQPLSQSSEIKADQTTVENPVETNVVKSTSAQEVTKENESATENKPDTKQQQQGGFGMPGKPPKGDTRDKRYENKYDRNDRRGDKQHYEREPRFQGERDYPRGRGGRGGRGRGSNDRYNVKIGRDASVGEFSENDEDTRKDSRHSQKRGPRGSSSSAHWEDTPPRFRQQQQQQTGRGRGRGDSTRGTSHRGGRGRGRGGSQTDQNRGTSFFPSKVYILFFGLILLKDRGMFSCSRSL